MEAYTLTSFLGSATEVFTWIMENVGTVISTIVQNPPLLAVFVVSLAGLAVGMFSRIKSAAQN